YRAEADRLWKECDEPELARRLEEAEFLSEADARRWQRCHAEQRIAFLRSEQALCKALDRDGEADDELNGGAGSAGGAGAEESPDREEEAADTGCAGEAENPLAPGAGVVPSPDPQTAAPTGTRGADDPLLEEERILPSEPRIAPEPAPQVMSPMEDP